MGLDVELFEGEVAPELLCVVCHKVLVQPVHSACTHLFCHACLKRQFKAADKTGDCTCPACDTRLTKNGKTRAPSVDVKVQLLNLLIRCSHGCGKVCALADLPDHVTEDCPYAPVKCLHVQQGCRMTVKRAELEEHVEECEHRTVQCEACGQRTIFADLFTHQSRKRCLEKKLRQQLIKAVRLTNTEVKQHRRQLQRQHVRLEQQQRQRVMDHHRYNTASRLQQQQRRHQNHLHAHNDSSSSNVSEYDSPRAVPPTSPLAPLLVSDTGLEALPQHFSLTSLRCSDVALTSPRGVDVTLASPRGADVVFLTSSSLPLMEDGEMTPALNTPSPSRTGLSVATCRNCCKAFRETLNSPTACRWHPGTCYSCGRLDYQKGCMMGYHEL